MSIETTLREQATSWGIRSHHGEWSDGETQQQFAKETADLIRAELGGEVVVEAVARAMVHHRWPGDPITDEDRQQARRALAAVVETLGGE